MLADDYRLRLLDRVLAPLPGRDPLYPGRIVEVSLAHVRKDGGPGFVVGIHMDHRRGDLSRANAEQVVLDIDLFDTGREHATHAHAVRCAVADLRRAADGFARSDAEARLAVEDLQQRVSMYAAFEDIQFKLMAICATVLITITPQQRSRSPFKEQILDGVRRGVDQLGDLRLTSAERESQREFLTGQARRLEADYL
jgi:hypothetical protein